MNLNAYSWNLKAVYLRFFGFYLFISGFDLEVGYFYDDLLANSYFEV